MPYFYDFNKLSNVEEYKLNIEGYIPLTIVYGIGTEPKSGIDSIFFKVKGTEHVFGITMRPFLTLYNGNYELLFRKTLEVFKETYKEWRESDFELPYQMEYYEQFKNYIL